MESSFGPRKPGVLKIDALLNDSEDMGAFLTDLVANNVRLDVAVDTGFAVTIDFRDCELTDRGAPCTSDANGTRTKLGVTRFWNAPNVFRLKRRALARAVCLTIPVHKTRSFGSREGTRRRGHECGRIGTR